MGGCNSKQQSIKERQKSSVVITSGGLNGHGYQLPSDTIIKKDDNYWQQQIASKQEYEAKLVTHTENNHAELVFSNYL